MICALERRNIPRPPRVRNRSGASSRSAGRAAPCQPVSPRRDPAGSARHSGGSSRAAHGRARRPGGGRQVCVVRGHAHPGPGDCPWDNRLPGMLSSLLPGAGGPAGYRRAAASPGARGGCAALAAAGAPGLPGSARTSGPTRWLHGGTSPRRGTGDWVTKVADLDTLRNQPSPRERAHCRRSGAPPAAPAPACRGDRSERSVRQSQAADRLF